MSLTLLPNYEISIMCFGKSVIMRIFFAKVSAEDDIFHQGALKLFRCDSKIKGYVGEIFTWHCLNTK